MVLNHLTTAEKGTHRKFLKFTVVLATLLTVFLYLDLSDIAEHLNNPAFDSYHTTSEGAHFEVNSQNARNFLPVAEGNIAMRPCDKISNLFSTYARSNHLSDFDIDCLLDHYKINGIQYLNKASKLKFLKCNPDYTRYGHKGLFQKYLNVKPTNLGSCTNLTDMRFINGTRVITLVSFPGSGNTWTRLLLEQVTGIFTGSIYCDEDLRSNGFFGEWIISSNVLAVKTHYPGAGKPKLGFSNPAQVDGVIFIIRNPLDSMIAERKRQVLSANSHTGDVGPEHFGTNKQWKSFVHATMHDTFPALVRYWLDKVNISILVIKYEDMLTDLSTQLKKMLDFLQVPYSKTQLDCVLNNQLNRFHRKKVSGFDHYTPELRKMAIEEFKKIESLLNKYNITYRDVLYNAN